MARFVQQTYDIVYELDGMDDFNKFWNDNADALDMSRADALAACRSADGLRTGGGAMPVFTVFFPKRARPA